MTDAAPVFIGPDPLPWLCEAVEQGGGQRAALAAAEAVVWFGFPDNFPDLPSTVRWVQLPFAGVEPWLEAGLLDADSSRTWTSGGGVYADTVAEHALALLLSGVRGLGKAATSHTWDPGLVAPAVGSLRGSTVGIVGAGGIGRALIPMLHGLGARVIAVNRSGLTVESEDQGPIETVPVAQLDNALPHCDHLILCAPSTEASQNLLGERQLRLLRPHSWIVNVGRGSLVDTDSLAQALARGEIGGAGLDVTEPEPLPDGHPLWRLPNVIITPHIANPPQGIPALLGARIAENVRRFREGRSLLGRIDPSLGY